jgi:HK97 family phage major capsid protein/HK97 family phage prohead protease
VDTQRAYSLITIKAVDEDARTITGIATTPETDRMGDIVEPKGAQFKLPIPLLWQHRADQPIGHVIRARVTDAGIEITAKLARIDEPGTLKDRLDEAWHSIKSGLVGGLSIGFSAIDAEPIKGTFGLRFLKWLWLELSAVTIPANAAASIQTVKSLDAPFLAASGTGTEAIARPSAGVSAPVVRAMSRGPQMPKTIQEQIKDYEATRAAKSAERNAIMAKSAETGETLDDAQSQAYDGLSVELKSIDAHLVRLNDLAAEQQSAAVEVKGANVVDASRSRGATSVVSVKENTPPGIGMARVVLCKMASYLEFQRGNFTSAVDIARKRYPSDPRVAGYIQKTAVAGGLTTDSTWAAELAEVQTLNGEFIEYLRHQTILGKLNLRRYPFNVRVPRQTTGGTGYWVGQGKPKPLTSFAFDDVTMPFTKVAAIAVITQELARFSTPSAEAIVRDQLVAACRERLDVDLIDPAKAVSSGVNPASLTNGVTALTSAGTAAANVITDINNLLEQFLLNKQDPSNVVLIMPNTLALAISLMLTANGLRQFPDLTMNGGSLVGIPVITSQHAASGASYGNMIIAIDQSAVALADDGNFSVDVSTEASLQMDDAPTNDASTGTGQSLVSMFQTNSIAIRAEREIHWIKLRSTAVSYLDDVTYGASGSPV